ncbi:MAG: ABC transporter ATP-binding protein [Bacteroidia bacterium]|nr:ABC transporter ATP-binding protein [Bacteroidia bacterium]
MKDLRSLNPYFFRYKWRLLLGVVFVGLSNFFGVLLIPKVGLGVDLAQQALQEKLPEGELSTQLLTLGVTVILYAVISGVFMFLMRQTIIVMSRMIEYDMKNDIFTHYQRLDTGFYKRNSTGDLMNRISEDVSRVRMYIGPAIMYLVNTTVTLITVISFMGTVDMAYTAYVLLPLPVLAYVVYKVSNVINRKSNLVQSRLSDLSTHSQETYSGIRVLKAFALEDENTERFRVRADDYRTSALSLAKTEAFFQPAMILMIGLSTLLVVYIGGLETINGNLSGGKIPDFILYVNKLLWPVASLGWVTSLIQRAAASQVRINEFLHTAPVIYDRKNAVQQLEGDICFENVSLRYPDSGIEALKGISFRIPQGNSLAIVGRTGCGKSTIAGLLVRLMEPDSGTISIGAHDLRDIQLGALRSGTGYVPQEVFLFSDTIANNIAFTSGKIPDRKAVEQAAKDAVIHQNILEFPMGYETMVGERGITLSGGQKQRVSIARAIVKEPQILVFDDCLSAVDTETEDQILKNLDRVMKGKTTLIISHRISSVKGANHILYMEEGKIREEGSHQELLALKGRYYDLHLKQLLESEKNPV